MNLSLRSIFFNFLVLTIFVGFAMVSQAAPVTLYSNSSVTVDNVTALNSGLLSVTGYENIIFSFDYDAESLNNGDFFTYGWRDLDGDHILGTVLGVNESNSTSTPPTDTDEIGSINKTFLVAASDDELEVFVRVSSNTVNNVLSLNMVIVEGDLKEIDPILTITAPELDFSTVSGIYDFTAFFLDDDEIEDDILWSIRVGSCDNYTDAVAGNIDDLSNPSTFNDAIFGATVNTNSFIPGNYCFIVDPQEQVNETNLIAFRDFVIGGYGEDTYTIEGIKWNDADGDGKYEEETTLAGWVIEANKGDIILTATTSEDGSYSFEVEAGEWSVYEIQQDGWTQTGIIRNEVSIFEPNVELACEFVFGNVGNPILSFASEVQSTPESNTCDFGNQQDEAVDPEPTPTPDTNTGGKTTGTKVGFRNAPASGLVLGAATEEAEDSKEALTCSLFLYDFMKLGSETYAWEVMKLQSFLTAQGWETETTGVFDENTDRNIRLFQDKYSAEVLAPWGLTAPTGYVYKTTRWKINNIVCPGSQEFPTVE